MTEDSSIAVSFVREIHVFSNPGAGRFLAPTLAIAVLEIFDVFACGHPLTINVGPINISSMRAIAVRDDSEEMLKLAFIHHASVRTPCLPFGLWR